MVYVQEENTPTFRHATIEGAEAEAKRLAELSGKKAYVLCSIKSVELSKFAITDMRPQIEYFPFNQSKMTKPISQWISELPDEYRELAEKNARKSRNKTHEQSIASAISSAFIWAQTPEKGKFWLAVHNHYALGSKLPELPGTVEVNEPVGWGTEYFTGIY